MVFEGTIISSLGGSYKVAADGREIICSARGVFRAKEITPLCGDRAVISEEGSSAVITEILPRKNEIIRPPLANLDCMVFVISTCEPAPNIPLLDKFLAVCEFKGISPVIVLTKTDKQSADGYVDIYKSIYPTFCVDNSSGRGCEDVKAALKGKFSAVTGNSGSGKSSLLNNICPELGLETDEISRKLGRGKHTTRRVDIYRLDCGGYIADTPGFSTFETRKYDIIMKDELADCFPEFEGYLGKCRFFDCSHTKESGCAVIEAVESGKISRSRHKSYVEMYAESAKIKPWDVKPKSK